MTKYSKDGMFPHEKLVNLSMDLQNFCWSDLGKQGSMKSIPVKTISQVTYQKLGEGIKKHNSNIKKNLFCVIDYITKDNKMKTIELGSQSAD